MTKVSAVWLSLVMLFSFVVVVDVIIDFTPTVQGGSTLYVNETGSGGAFTSIQDAINVSNDGDTVFVYSGTYYENVVVNKSINLTGEDRDTTIINGSGSGDIARIIVDYVNLTGLTITNGNRGIYISSDNVLIFNTSITSIQGENGVSGGVGEDGYVGAGIYLDSSIGTNISNNKIFDIDSGTGGNSNNFGNNGGVGGTGAGIYLQTSTNTTIINNTISIINGGGGGTGGNGGSGGAGGLGAGIYLQTSTNNTIINDIINTINGGTGGTGGQSGSGGAGGLSVAIYLQTSTNNTIINNTIDTISGGKGGTGGWLGSGGAGGVGAGIYLISSTSNTIINSTIDTINGGTGGVGGSQGSDGASQGGFGIFIDNNSLNNIIELTNTIDGNKILYYYNQNGITIENYRLKSDSNPTNYGKIVLINCNDFTIKNNEIANFTGISGGTQGSGGAGGVGAGIYLQTSTNNTIINNTINTINGGTGGTGGRAGSGGTGGLSAGIYLQTSTNYTIINNTINTINGGTGGSGGYLGSGGAGGLGAGIYLNTSTNNTIINNTINTINGGTGGTGGVDGSNGTSQVGFGIFIDSNSLNNIIEPTNTIDGDEILYYYNQNGITIEKYFLKSNSNPTNYGKIVLINCDEFTIKNNEVTNFTGISGGTGGKGDSGGTGGTGGGIYLQTSTNNTIINNTINSINGRTGGAGGYFGSGGAGGLGVGICLQTSTNNTIMNNTINTINGGKGGTGGYGGSGGAGGIGAGIYLNTSTNNNIINNTINTINGGTGGTGGVDGSNGTSQVGFGIFIDSNSLNNIIEPTNTMDGDEILYYYNQNGITIEKYFLKSNSNPTNYGKIVLINCNDFTIKNNDIANFTGISGGTGGYDEFGGAGSFGAGIYVQISTNNTIVNNTINTIKGGVGGTGGTYHSGAAGDLGAGIYLQTSTNNTIIDNTVDTINGGKGGTGGYLSSGGAGGLGVGIYLNTSTNNTIINNTINTINGGTGGTGGDEGSNGSSQVGFGIFIDNNSLNNIIEPTNTIDGDEILYYYNQNGMTIENYSLKSNSNPTNYGKIVLINCNDFTIKNNKIANFIGMSGGTGGRLESGGGGGTGTGIYLRTSTNNIIINNSIIVINGGTGGTGGYGGSGGAGGLGAGICLQTSTNNTIINNTINIINGGTGGTGGLGSSGGEGGLSAGIYLHTSMNNAIINQDYSNNDRGIYLYSSSNNTIANCSISSNSNYDFYLQDNSKNNIAINTTFNTTFVDSTSELIVKNYLHIQVNDSSASPAQNVDVKVEDNVIIIYATLGYGGSDPKTNTFGQIKWILVTDRIYDGSSTATENTTTVTVEYAGLDFKNNNRDVNMSTSHFEYFFPNYLPTNVILKGPSNDTFINDSTPELKWYASIDADDEPITYIIEVDELGGDWSSLVDGFHTSIGVLSWNITTILIDGQSYQWRVRANDSRDNGTWSEVWEFTIDTDRPSSTITAPVNGAYLNSLPTISGTASDSDGSNVKMVQINIKREDVDEYWDGSGWVDSEIWLTTSGTTSWSYDSSSVDWSTDTNYTIRSQAIDNANNVETPGVGITFLLDNQPPTSLSILINNGDEYTNSTSVILSLNGEDSGSGLYQMAFSTDGVAWTDWESYNISKSYILSSDEGSKTVYFRVQDKAGNIAPYVFYSIILDTTSPTVTSIILSDPSPTRAGTVTFTITFSENMSTAVSPTVTFGKTSPYETHNINQASYSNNTWIGTFEIDTTTGDGANTINVSMAEDLAGNQMVLNASYTFIIDTVSPIVTYTLTGTDVEVSETLTITFSEPMNFTSVENSIIIFPDVSILNYSWDGNTLTITFSSDLSYGTEYNVIISTGAKDLAGNALEELYSWDFTTEAKPEDGFPLLWLMILLIIIVIIVLLLVWILMRRRPEELEEEAEFEEAEEVPLPPPKKAMIAELLEEMELEEGEEEEVRPPPPKKAMVAELLEEGELEEVGEEAPPEKATIEELSEEEEEEEVEEEEVPPPPPKKAKRRKKLSEEELDRLDLPEPDEEF